MNPWNWDRKSKGGSTPIFTYSNFSSKILQASKAMILPPGSSSIFIDTFVTFVVNPTHDLSVSFRHAGNVTKSCREPSSCSSWSCRATRLQLLRWHIRSPEKRWHISGIRISLKNQSVDIKSGKQVQSVIVEYLVLWKRTERGIAVYFGGVCL